MAILAIAAKDDLHEARYFARVNLSKLLCCGIVKFNLLVKSAVPNIQLFPPIIQESAKSKFGQELLLE